MRTTRRWFQSLILAACSTTLQAQAQTPVEADVTPATLATIADELGCKKAVKREAIAGCAILAEFALAGTPDSAILKADGGLKGKRLLGRTIVSDRSDKPTFAFKATTPFEVLMVLGSRYSANFHRKMYFAEGFGYAYIWAVNERQEAMIAQASKDLQQGVVGADSAPATFARRYDLEFLPTRASTGKSVFIGDGTMLRQRGNMLYVLGIGESRGGTPIYYLSQARADRPIR